MTPLNSASNTPLFFWTTLALIILVAYLWTACQKLYTLCHGNSHLTCNGDTVYVDDLECGIPDMYSPEDEVPAEEAFVDNLELWQICDTLM